MKIVKNMQKFGFSALLFAYLLVHAASVFAAANTYYVCQNAAECNAGQGSGWNSGDDGHECTQKSEPCATIQGGIEKISGADKLIIGDGVYNGDNNAIITNGGSPVHIPEGSDVIGYTQIHAENDGGVTIHADGATGVKIYGDDAIDGNTGLSLSHDYIELKGIVVSNSAGGGILLSNVNHVKIINCGVVDTIGSGAVGIGVSYSNYVLVEGCYIWGGEGNYRLLAYHADHTIIRNCVARIDRTVHYAGGTGGFSIYSSTNIEVQNSIVIDSDTSEYWEYGDMIGAFGAPTTSGTSDTGPINFKNCISINNNMRFGSLEWNNYPADVRFLNCIGWDHKTRGTHDFIHSQGSSKFNHCTFGEVDTQNSDEVSFSYYNGWKDGNDDSSENSIYYNFLHGDLFYDIERCINNNVYGLSSGFASNAHGTTVQNESTYNPKTNGLLYLPRVEPDSQLEQSGIGANIIKMCGKPGTLWGEDGYNLLQDGTNGQNDIDLWPFPNEELIKLKMQGYRYDNGNLTGDRGFASSTAQKIGGGNVTLTSYIWEYLGNEIPCEIYDTCSCNNNGTCESAENSTNCPYDCSDDPGGSSGTDGTGAGDGSSGSGCFLDELFTR